jgi:hypothetical protein
MPSWSWKDILEQLAVIRAAPVPSAVMTIAIIGIIWGAMNWSYSSVIVSKSSQIELLEKQITDCKDKLNGKSPSDARGRIDALKARVSRVEPRKLSPEQKKTITGNVMLPIGASYALSIESDMGCLDCNQYADEFSGILSGAHWMIRTPMIERPGTKSLKGIAVLSPDTSNPLPAAAALMRALKAADIPFDLMPGSDMNFDPQGTPSPISAMVITAKVTP